MNWTLLVVIVIVNTLFALIQYFVQQMDKKNGRIQKKGSLIPGTNQRFLYWENFRSQTYGDFIFLPLLAYAFFNNPVMTLTVLEIIVLMTTCLGSFFGMWYMCTAPNHKPDWGYPESGKISFGGVSHLPYFGFYVGMISVLIMRVITRDLVGLDLYIALAGGIGYMATWTIDLLEGHFDPLKEI